MKPNSNTKESTRAKYRYLGPGVLLLVLSTCGNAQESTDQESAQSGEEAAREPANPNPLLSPDQVENQMAADREVNPLYESKLLEPIISWRDQLATDHGVRLGLDYSTVAVATTDSPGEDGAASGMVRFYGSWDIVNRNKSNTGTFIWKIEHRHKYTTIPVSGLGLNSGYVGIYEPPFSDQGFRLTNLHWKQRFSEGKGAFVAGFLDVTDFVDVYLLASPWTGFMNFAFSTGSASMDLPNDATLGAGAGYMIADTIYAQAGLSDANSDPTSPWDGFGSMFSDADLYTWAEIGWTPGNDKVYFDNAHVTFWHIDSRANGTPSGWGINASYQRWFDEKWLPFLRAGYADRSGSLLEYSVSAGVGYQPIHQRGVIAVGVNWGRPNPASFGEVGDQITAELFWRYQLTKEFAITPALQYINNPALNPDTDNMWVFGLRGRLVF